MIARGCTIDPAGEQFSHELLGDPEPTGRVFDIRHDKIHGEIPAQLRQPRDHDITASTPDQIT